MDKAYCIDDLRELANYSGNFSQMGKDYLISRLRLPGQMLTTTTETVRLDGLTMLLTLKGSMKIMINTETYDLTENSLMVTGPGSTFRPVTPVSENLEAYFLFISPKFVADINIDLNVLQKSHLSHKRSPLLPLKPEKAILLGQYMEMLHISASANPVSDIITKNISRSLISALVYQLMQIADTMYDRDIDCNGNGDSRTGARRLTYVKEFMTLVHSHYSTERTVGFYASKLCISPKYLSFIIKEVTGRSAADWIDEYVIIEAKNMLRFSGMNVQQVAYALNFSNQSAFGKYFKHLTGMSPTQFQKN